MMTRSTHFVHVAKNLLNVLQGYTKGVRFMLIMFLTLTVITHAWGAETVTYTVSSTSAVEISGTAPTGSSAIYNSTYNTAYQLIADNSMTLTLSGYDGCQITGLTLRMRSNTSGGAGNMSMKIGSTTVSSISTAKFNTNSWYGSWSTSYVDIAPSVTATTVGDGENVVIIIAATANSLYCQSFTLTYEPAEGSDNPSTDDCEVMYDFTEINDWSNWESSYTKHEVTYSDAIVTFSSANKQTTTITDCPVTKGNDVSLVMTDGSTLSGVKFMCKQWGGKTQTITLNYSTDGGKNYTSTGITSTNFTISSNNLPIGTNAVKITFSSTSNQVGISSCTIQKVCITETTVSLNLNGGTFEVEPEGWGNNAGTYIQNIVGGEEITLPTPTKNGYTFIGWSDGTNSFSGTYIVPTEEVTLYAQWQEILVSNNCRWIETEIEDIQPEDEVVVTMGNDEIGYALGTEKITNSPKSQAIAIQDGVIKDGQVFDYAKYSWNIYSNNGGYTLSPNGVGNTFLYGVSSYISIGNNSTNNVFYLYTNQENGNKCFFYTINDKFYFLSHGTENEQDAWKRFEGTTFLNSNTLKFYKKTCLSADELWVDCQLANASCTNTPPHSQISNDSEDLLLEFTANEGYLLPEEVDVQMEGGSLDFQWEKTSGLLTIHKPDGGYTGDITITISGCKALAAPTNLSAVPTSTSVTLSWNAVEDAQGYEVLLLDKDYNDIVETTTTCEITITGLTKNTYYVWGITPIKEGFCGIQEASDFTTLQTYTVTFDNNGHSQADFMPDTQTVDHGTFAQEPNNDPTDNGYSFEGWFDNKECSGEVFNFTETPITANTTLYAKWDIVTYNITYTGLEGATNNADNPTTYTIETPTIAFQAPSARDGYIFKGWNPATLAKGTYGNQTITATWEKGKVVTWKVDDVELESRTYKYGDPLVLPTQEVDACQGAEHVGWTTEYPYFNEIETPDNFIAKDKAIGSVNSDITYHAVFANLVGDNTDYSNTYTSNVTITGTSASVTTNSTKYDAIKAGTSSAKGEVGITIPGGTTKLYFHMVGWKGEGGKTITLSGATAVPSTFTTIANENISGSSTNFTLDDVSQYSYVTSLSGISQETSITLSSSKGNERFVVWGVNASSSAYVNYSTTCSAIYTIIYVDGGDFGCEDGSVKEGNDYTICDAKPTKTGYTFKHWSDGINTYAAGATIENVQSNITLTAVWEANTYTITWMSNGEEYATTTHTYNQPLEIPSEPYTCYGTKTFIGWTEADNVSEDGGGITYVDDSTNPSANKTYYAIFADEVISEPDEVEATLSFANTSQRTSFSTTQQVWEQNGIELTNTQGSGDNDAPVADYANPARFYAHSSINISAPGNITKVVFVCSGESYAAPMEKSAGNSATSDGTNVTVILDGSSNTFDIASVTAQVRLSSITVTYQSTPEPITSNYTTTPSGCPDIEVAENAYVTSTSGQGVKVKVPVTISNYFDGITLSANIEGESNFTIANLSSIKEGAATLEIAYKPTAYNTTENATITLVANKGENKVTATDFTVNGRSLPETFAIVAKVGNLWYALPSQGLNSTDALLGYPVEVDNMEDPTAVASVPTNADWSLRQVYASTGSGDRFTANGNNLVFVNNSDPVKALNASQEGNYLLTDAQYANYYATNPSLYEWIPTTTDLENYTLTNAQRMDRILNVATNTAFGVHSDNKATTEVRFLPITNRYIQAALQVVEWKENSVVVMYNGDPAQTASVSVNGATAQDTVLSAAQRDIAVYELTANGLATNPTQRLSITIGTEKTILSIPYIISGSKTDKEVLPGSTVSAQQEAAKIADLVVLNGATFTAAGAKGNPYKFRNVTVYGGGKLVIPSEKGFGVNTLTLRIGGVTSEGNYDYVYPEFVLNTQYEGAYSNTSGKINLDYVTTKEQYYTFVAPFAVQTKDIKYPVEIYGSNVAANNRGSFEFQYYNGAARAAGERGWKVVEEDPANGATLTAHQGYTFYGMPKKVSVNGGTSTRQKFGIHRIPMSVKAADAMTHENNEQTVAVAAYPAEKKINAGWNLIGNPYMSTITGLDNQSILTGTIVLTDDRWQWSDQGTSANRFIVFPSDDGECYYTSQASNATLPAFKNFFVQISENVNTLSIPYTSRTSPSQAPAHRTAQEIDEDIELAIVLEQDEQQADQMDFLLNDTYSALFDYNADFTKMMNNTNLNLFGVYMDDKLSFVAMDPLSAQRSVAIGYQVPQAGQYTLRLSDKPYAMWSRVEAIYVTDHEVTPKITTNLLNDPYTFQVATAETNTTRFTISIVPSKESGGTTTAVDNLLYQDIHTQKIIYNDQLYILSDGVVYDARGQRIITINK